MTDSNYSTLPPENNDEISLREIYEIIRQKRLLIIIATVLCAAIAGAYSFIHTETYAYQACVSMGIIGRDQNGQPIFVDSTQGALAQLDNAYIPSTLDSFLNKQKKLSLDAKKFKTFSPKDSTMVCIKTDAPRHIGNIVSQIQNTVLQQLVNDNSKFSAVQQTSTRANIKQLQATAQNLQTQIANVLAQEHTVNTELTLLKTKDSVLQNQGHRLTQMIDEMRPLVQKGIGSVHNDSTALTMMIQNNQVAQEQQQLFKIEMERSVTLPKEQASLLNTLNALKGKENDLNTKVAANAAQMELAQASLKALQTTHIVRPSSASLEPVGPGKGVFIILGAFIGLILSIFYALLAHTLAPGKQ